MSASRFPFLSILTLLFITLKLTNYINWNWFWVLSPSLFQFLVIFILATASAIKNQR